MLFRTHLLGFFVILSFCVFGVSLLYGQELSEKQRGIAERYSQLEQVLLRMSEATASSDPKRAALLKRVLFVGKDKLVSVQLDNLVRLLGNSRFTETITGQENVEKDLIELLRLLESENRDQSRDAEKERVKQFLRDLEELIHQEKTLKTKTTQRENERLSPLENEQRDIRLRSQTLRERIDRHEDPLASREHQTSPEENEEKKPDEHSSDDSKEDGKNGDDEKNRPSDPKGEQDKEKNDGKSNEPDNRDAKKSEDSKNSNEKDDANGEEKPSGSPTQQAMQRALSRMRQAEQKLKNAEKNGALEDQEEAIAQLQRAKAELERILRQIREEELMQTLEKLEARFKRMLKAEQAIRSQTEKLFDERKTVDASAQRQIEIQTSRLVSDQQTVIADADDALVLLREDGTAQAMTESLLQARFDMVEIQQRLSAMRLDAATLEIEDSVIAALQEMLDAVSQAIKEAENRKNNPDTPPGGEGGQQEVEPLIQLLSELKMIRSMQQRVNDRTKRYDRFLEDMKKESRPDFDSLRKKVEELARQQNRISRILHDLKVGRTQ